jgi:sigma-B regulation protein RsbU (phosphoserine phosphatase)
VAVASQISVAVENAHLHAALIEKTQFDQESQDAHEVQQALLPECPPLLPGYDFWDFYEPAHSVGGDYFDYLPVLYPDDPDGSAPRRWWLVVGDVVGKGMPAALLMARLSAEVRLFALTMSEPVRIVERLNRDFCLRAIGERFITFLLVLVDAELHRITVVSAGHNGPIIRRGDGTLETIGDNQAGPPLGVTEQAVYSTSSALLEPGDLVLLYTDGLVEAMDVTGQCFGGERLRRLLAAVPSGAANAGEALIRAIQHHAAGCAQSDDITLLCFERARSTFSPPS